MTIRAIPYGNGLVRVTMGNYTGVVEVQGGRVSWEPPPLKYMHNWTWRVVQGYCEDRGGKCELVRGLE